MWLNSFCPQTTVEPMHTGRSQPTTGSHFLLFQSIKNQLNSFVALIASFVCLCAQSRKAFHLCSHVWVHSMSNTTHQNSFCDWKKRFGPLRPDVQVQDELIYKQRSLFEICIERLLMISYTTDGCLNKSAKRRNMPEFHHREESAQVLFLTNLAQVWHFMDRSFHESHPQNIQQHWGISQ